MTTHTSQKNIHPLLITAAYYLSFIILGFATAADGPSLPTLARHTASALNQISLIFVFGSLGYLFGSFFGGRMYDRLPGHRFMAVMLLVLAVAAIFIPLASSLWILILAVLVAGFSKGALDVGCNTLLQWVHGEKVGPFMNGLHFFFGIGSFLAPVLLAQIIQATHEIYWVFWTISLGALPIAIWIWLLPEPPIHTHTEKQDHSPMPLLPVSLIVLAFVLYVGAEVGFANWIYTYATKLNLADSVTAAYLNSAFWGSFTIGRLLGVWISTRSKSRTILFTDLAGCVLSLSLILIGRESATALWIGSMGLGLSMASIFPTTMILAGEHLRITGTITGWFLVGSSVGGMLLPWLIGEAFTLVGPYAMMVIILVDIVLNWLTLLYFAYAKRTTVTAIAS